MDDLKRPAGPAAVLCLAGMLAFACGAPPADRQADSGTTVPAASAGGAAPLQEMKDAAAKNPSDADAHFRLGVALLDAGSTKEAIEALAVAVKLDPARTDTYLALGNAYLAQEDRRSAFLAFNEAVLNDPNNPAALYNLGVLHYM